MSIIKTAARDGEGGLMPMSTAHVHATNESGNAPSDASTTSEQNGLEVMRQLRARYSPGMVDPEASLQRISSLKILLGPITRSRSNNSQSDRHVAMGVLPPQGPMTRSRSGSVGRRGIDYTFRSSDVVQEHILGRTESCTDRIISDMIKNPSLFQSVDGGLGILCQQPHNMEVAPRMSSRQTSLDIFKSSGDPFQSADSVAFKNVLADSHEDIDYYEIFLPQESSLCTSSVGSFPMPVTKVTSSSDEAIHCQAHMWGEFMTQEEHACKVKAPTRKRRGRPIKKKEPKQEPIVEKRFINGIPSNKDVLCGRGGRTNHHPGNVAYLLLKDAMQARYMAASKVEKTIISQELVNAIHERCGRFLKIDVKAENTWYEIDDSDARKKASQTLREINTPEARQAKRQRYVK